MNKILLENNYLYVENFLAPEKARELYDGFKELSVSHPHKFRNDAQCPKSLATINYDPFVELLLDSVPFLQDTVEEKLTPTYSYARAYKNGDMLAPHTDIDACEVSVTLHLGSDGVEWPIYFTKPNGEVVGMNLQPGQGVIYLGCVSEHWRDTYEGYEYGQVFLHYVRSRKPDGNYFFNKA